MATFQTLSDFLEAPFGNTDETERKRLETMYQRMKRSIRIEGYLKFEKEYLMHVIVPSESNPNQSYDVVVLFFAENDSVERELTLKNYYVKLFSNSPSFIFQFAAMYHTEGYLIDFLFEKMDKDYAEVMPKKPKPLFYDKSIYAACRYLSDDKFVALSKMGIITKHRKNERTFFNDIKTFQDVKMTGELRALDKKIDKELEENKKQKKKEKKGERKRPKTGTKVLAKKDTLTDSRKKAVLAGKRIKARKSTRK